MAANSSVKTENEFSFEDEECVSAASGVEEGNSMAHVVGVTKCVEDVCIDHPHQQSDMLHSTQNAWKPLCRDERTIGEKEKLKRNVQAVLNKLTFQKFKILLSQLKKLNINTDDELELVVNLIYDNAINEPHFCVLYANLCKHLSSKMPFDSYTSNKEFCLLLLNKCESGFLEECQVTNEDVCGMLLPFYMQESIQLKSRRIGNIRFICELFKLKMIPNSKIFGWIGSLLENELEDHLEYFYWFMKSTGKELESQDKNMVNGFFQLIGKIIDSRCTSSRIRFLLQDIIDLRKNNWISRRLENCPRTIDQIHQEIMKSKCFRDAFQEEMPGKIRPRSECSSSCVCRETDAHTSERGSNPLLASNRVHSQSIPDEVKNLFKNQDIRKHSRKGRGKKKSSGNGQNSKKE